jgi:D-sedoheptulose 7-phosphate isomerase
VQAMIRQALLASSEVFRLTINDSSIADAVYEAASVTAQAMLRGNKLMVAGNGGSAADAQHLVAEFVSRLTINRPAMRALALTTDSSILTAVGNDYAFENIFERQIEALGQKGDIFMGISTSGNSKNIIKALIKAKELGLKTIGYSGNGGGAMAALTDINVVVPSAITMNIQEVQLSLEHIFCMLVERCYFGEDFENFVP